MTDTTPKPPARRSTPARKARTGEVRMEHMLLDVPEGEPLTIPYRADGVEPPEVQILGVTRVEGHGFGQFVDRWQVVVIWR